MKQILLSLFGIIFIINVSYSENGYELWLRYNRISDPIRFNEYVYSLKQVVFPANNPTLLAAKQELEIALSGMLQLHLPLRSTLTSNGALLVGTPHSLKLLADLPLSKELGKIGAEGYLIKTLKVNNYSTIVITANTDIGVLYGVFNFLKRIQTLQSIQHLSITDYPRIQYRLLDHWDNQNGTIERGYAGSSLWDWQRLPGYIDPRYVDYARANASVGINGAVLNNVNANARILTKEYLLKVASLATVFKIYGIKVYLSARFSAPIELGRLQTADPLDPAVKKWWKDKADEIYRYIPNFGGFLVKANSEGQPGPQDYKRTHADGANTLAEALEPHGGIVMWRAFIYKNKKGDDRAKEAYEEFKPLDGKFAKNVFVQPKNGPIDFQPREAIHPLLGVMPQTPMMLEFQLTQEYLGFATHLVYLAPLFKETLNHDTYAGGKGSTVAKIIEGQAEKHSISGITGVANIGSDINWCGHPFAQANWYAFGRIAWNPELDPGSIANDWLRMTFTNDPSFVEPVKELMLTSRETAVNYMTPLGLNHIMNFATHYGPGPWYKDKDWDARLGYHRADSIGLGFDRTTTGSNAVSQYFEPLRSQYNDSTTCPQKYLLWFHHVSWNHRMISGKTLWEELVIHYYEGVDSVKQMRKTWNKMEGKIDAQRFNQVNQLLVQQEKEARWWRDGCVLYFQTFSHIPIPAGYAIPLHSLSYYQTIPFPNE